MTILQELYNLYERKKDEWEETGQSVNGYNLSKIHFDIELDYDGNLVEIRENSVEGKQKHKQCLCPALPRRAANAAKVTGFIFDKYDYLLGFCLEEKYAQYAETFLKRLTEIFENTDSSKIRAIILFIERLRVDKTTIKDDELNAIKKIPGALLGIRIKGDLDYIWEDTKIKEYYLKTLISDDESISPNSSSSDNSEVYGQCLITGKSKQRIARLHEAQISFGKDKASIVSFNAKSYESYGRAQSYNAPTSEVAVKAYESALRVLFAQGTEAKPNLHKVILSDTHVAFWSEANNSILEDLIDLFSFSSKKEKLVADDTQSDQEKKDVKNLRALYTSPLKGGKAPRLEDFEHDRSRMFALGLMANRSRVVVRFWQVDSISETVKTISQWFEDIDIVDSKEYGYSVNSLLSSIALENKLDKLSPKLRDDVIYAVLSNRLLPYTLLSATVNRIRADVRNKYRINAQRVALLKAYLNRCQRFRQRSGKITETALTTSMDKSNTNPAYLCGRLFAVLEKIQLDAQGSELNTTVKDRFYSSASTTPVLAFPRMIQLVNHHLKKLKENRYRVYYEKLISEILEPIEGNFPKTLNLEMQGYFAVGYYHQNRALWQKKEETSTN